MSKDLATPSGEIIGLDLGEKVIGVARINLSVGLSEPLDPIRTSKQEPFSAISDIVSEHSAVGVVVGLPRGLNGQETAQTKTIRQFTASLKDKVDVQLYFIDEAGTSIQAKERLGDSSGSVDSTAAAIMLEDFYALKDKESLKV